jgi:hypothetical protein
MADDFGSLEPPPDYKKEWKNSKKKTLPTFKTDWGGGKSVDVIPQFTLLAQASLPQGLVAGSQEGKWGLK